METANTGNVLSTAQSTSACGHPILHFPVISPSDAREPVTVTVTT
jgi:hypothetical protein